MKKVLIVAQKKPVLLTNGTNGKDNGRVPEDYQAYTPPGQEGGDVQIEKKGSSDKKFCSYHKENENKKGERGPNIKKGIGKTEKKVKKTKRCTYLLPLEGQEGKKQRRHPCNVQN